MLLLLALLRVFKCCYVLHCLMLYFSYLSFVNVVQYISLLFIGILIVISVRGFLTNLMKVIMLSDIFSFQCIA